MDITKQKKSEIHKPKIYGPAYDYKKIPDSEINWITTHRRRSLPGAEEVPDKKSGVSNILGISSAETSSPSGPNFIASISSSGNTSNSDHVDSSSSFKIISILDKDKNRFVLPKNMDNYFGAPQKTAGSCTCGCDCCSAPSSTSSCVTVRHNI